MDAPNINYFWAQLILEELRRNGVERVVIVPGSRSAPLAVAAFRNPKIKTIVHYDERGAAFFALGCARVGKPAAVVCTSGSAVANCLPAVVEAFYGGTFFVILSADRPPELQNCGANQTIRQTGLFGPFIKGEDTFYPDVTIPAESVLAKVDALIAAAIADTPGPIHLNIMFREPLEPVPVQNTLLPPPSNRLREWEASDMPYTEWRINARTPDEKTLQHLAEFVAAPTGLLLIGSLKTKAEQEEALALANHIQWPVFADILSGCRRSDLCPFVVKHYDLLVRAFDDARGALFDRVLHIGDTFISKPLNEYLRRLKPRYVHISPRVDNRDPNHLAQERVVGTIDSICARIRERLPACDTKTSCEILLHADRAIHDYLVEQCTESVEELTELCIAYRVDELCPSEWILFLGNSMPVRDMDMVAAQCRSTLIYANRGVSGIDGNAATAAGMSWASGKQCLAVIGDMALLHDLNSLALVVAHAPNMIAVVVNNCGGGIFSFLPIAAHPDVFDPCFTNPHTLQFGHVADMFGMNYSVAQTPKELCDQLNQAMVSSGPTLVEVLVDRGKNVLAHKKYYENINSLIRQFLDASLL